MRGRVVDPMSAARAWYGARWRSMVAGAAKAARLLGMAPGLLAPTAPARVDESDREPSPPSGDSRASPRYAGA